MMDKIDALIHLNSPRSRLPWEGITEDRWAAQESVTTLYASLQIPKPRFAWCPSPKTMHVASRMLRKVQYGTAYSMVQSLVPRDGDHINREARVSLLTAMLDPDVTTQSGGLLIRMIEDVFGKPESTESAPAIIDLRRFLRFREEDPSGTVAPATFYEQAFYPALYPGLAVPRLRALQSQALIILPFVKLCWLCRPPVEIHTNEFGQLHRAGGPAARWSDGFEVFCDRTPPEPKTELPVSFETPKLEDGNADTD